MSVSITTLAGGAASLFLKITPTKLPTAPIAQQKENV